MLFYSSLLNIVSFPAFSASGRFFFFGFLEKSAKPVTVDESMTLIYTFQQDSKWILWYKQNVNQKPRFILSLHEFKIVFCNEFQYKTDFPSRTASDRKHLNVKNLSALDSSECSDAIFAGVTLQVGQSRHWIIPQKLRLSARLVKHTVGAVLNNTALSASETLENLLLGSFTPREVTMASGKVTMVHKHFTVCSISLRRVGMFLLSGHTTALSPLVVS